MNVLVTGGLGVVGAWVTRKLIERGLSVTVVDLSDDVSLLGSLGGHVKLVKADIMDAEAMRALFASRKIECVVHLAAMIAGLQSKPVEGFRLNALGTVQLLDAAHKAGVRRFVYTSSRAIYGDLLGKYGYPLYEPVPEDHPLGAKNVYDITKLATELMGRNFARAGLEFVALRSSTIFGPGKLIRHGAFSIYGRFIENAMKGVPLVIPKGGDERDDVIYVDDVAQGCLLAVTHPKPNYQEYNISRSVGTTLGQFADEVKRFLPEAEISIGPGLDFYEAGVKYAGVLDNRRAREDLGFIPRFDLSAAIEDYISQTRALGLPITVT